LDNGILAAAGWQALKTLHDRAMRGRRTLVAFRLTP